MHTQRSIICCGQTSHACKQQRPAVNRNILTSSWVRGPRSPSIPGSSACWRLRTHGTCYRPPDPAWRDPRLGRCCGAYVTEIWRGGGDHGQTGIAVCECVSVWGGGCEVEQASQLASLCSQAERERGGEGGRGPGIPPRVRRSQCAPSSAPWSDCQKQQSRCRWGSEKGADESLGDSAAEVRHRDGEASGCWGREETDP